MKYNSAIRIALFALCFLCIPVVAMFFVEGWNWSFGDYVLVFLLLFGAGSIYDSIARKGEAVFYKMAVAVTVASSLLMVWANLAVGFIGGEDNPINLMYFAVPPLLLVGGFLSKFKATGLSYTLFVVALFVAVIPFCAVYAGRVSGGLLDLSPGVPQIFGPSLFFAIVFGIAGMLFKYSDR